MSNNTKRAFAIGAMLLGVSTMLTGCSATSALTGLIGSKPDITAQAGQENVKQTLGVNAKQDTSSKQETSFDKSTVGKVDTSSKKRENATSITAEKITADKIEIHNSEGSTGWIAAGVLSMLLILALTYINYKRK
ncbi:hypothetical protein [Gibbsiella quercinecans]|uniref:hypothetical protein n=1 Tax=Gibbsiella quercinecans TaxID=929813 RepID=UPI00242DC8B8|nr:hypothetical protein [Gibbsiella quercinecans]